MYDLQKPLDCTLRADVNMTSGRRIEDMKTIAEVKDLLGIERRTLQEYDAIGLLHPSNIEDIKSGKLVKWLYDEDALRQLEIITIFREIGYTRTEIKTILDNPQSDFSEELL